MARIAGIDLPRQKRIEVALTYIYGIGATRSGSLLAKAGLHKRRKRWVTFRREARCRHKDGIRSQNNHELTKPGTLTRREQQCSTSNRASSETSVNDIQYCGHGRCSKICRALCIDNEKHSCSADTTIRARTCRRCYQV